MNRRYQPQACCQAYRDAGKMDESISLAFPPAEPRNGVSGLDECNGGQAGSLLGSAKGFRTGEQACMDNLENERG